MGEGTNNFAALMALKMLLFFVVEKVCRDLQVFGNSMIIINWVSGVQRCHITRLVPILKEVLDLKSHFDSFSLCPIYKEINQLADHCSKEAMQ